MRNVRVLIESVAFKGFGVARIDGKVVFVPQTVTGDEAWVEITEEKKRYAVARLIEIIERSPWRVTPPCPHFGSCGGCQWQHIDASVQGELKKEILGQILKRLGGLKDVPPISLAPSPKPYNARVRVQLKVKGKAIGYYQGRSHRIVEIDRCPIAHPLVNRIIQELRNELGALERMEEIEVNVSPEEKKGVLLFRPRSDDQEIEDFIKAFLKDKRILKGIAIAKRDGLHLFGDPTLNFTIPLSQEREKLELKLRISSGSFSQVNPEQNQRLIQTVLQFSGVDEEDRTFDLYAGAGNLTLPLATKAKEVWGIEENKTAAGDAQFNAERNGIKNCHVVQGRVEDILLDWRGEAPDLIVLDPPRAGINRILDHVVRLKAQKIIYVSCEPTTFARDLSLFSEKGYSLQRLGLIDMFPQTFHIEVVGLLRSPPG